MGSNVTVISGAFPFNYYFRNYAYATMSADMGPLQMGQITDLNGHIGFKNTAGTLKKLMCDASGASNMTQASVPFTDANGELTSDSGLQYTAGTGLKVEDWISGDGSSEGIQIQSDGDILINNSASQNWLISGRGTDLVIQGQLSGQSQVEIFNADDPAANKTGLVVYNEGAPSDITNRSRLQIVFDGSDSFDIWAEADGTGTLLPIEIYTEGNANQLTLATDGKVGIGVSDPDAELEIFDTGTQLKLSYDASNYCTFAVSSGGILTVGPSGGSTVVDSALTIDTIANDDDTYTGPRNLSRPRQS